MEKSRYEDRGVSSGKEDVHNAISHLYKGLFPNAFCKILPDVLGGDERYCNISHADGAGTKSSLAYAYWKETGDLSVWKGIAQDALVMNLDDLLCVGAGLQGEEFLYSLSIDRNKNLIPGEVISAIINGTQEFIDMLGTFGIKIHFAGGETADVGDLVRTITVNGTMTTRMLREDVIVPKMKSGDVIVGLASFGQSKYENEYNSGIGSNGLTSARHDLLHAQTGIKYPETFDPMMPKDLVYVGDTKLNELFSLTDIPTGKFILSPTRTYAPFLKELAEKFRDFDGSFPISAIIHNSGGGCTKVLNFIPETISIIKSNLFEIPLLFEMIQSKTETPWDEMYKTFNMGQRMEIYCSREVSSDVIYIADSFGVEGRVIGDCKTRQEGGSKLEILTPHGEFKYS
jgi:phosphoribosylformylglycinamidine cyclo-ligase